MQSLVRSPHSVCNRDNICNVGVRACGALYATETISAMLVSGVAVYRLSNRSLATVCMEQRRYLQCWC